MGCGRQGEHPGELFLSFDEILRSRGHAFHDRLPKILRELLQLAPHESVPNRSSPSRPLLSAHEEAFARMLKPSAKGPGPSVFVADKDYFPRAVFKEKALNGSPWLSLIVESKRQRLNVQNSDRKARSAVYNDRFALVHWSGNIRGGMGYVQRRYQLGLPILTKIGCRTRRGWANAWLVPVRVDCQLATNCLTSEEWTQGGGNAAGLCLLRSSV